MQCSPISTTTSSSPHRLRLRWCPSPEEWSAGRRHCARTGRCTEDHARPSFRRRRCVSGRVGGGHQRPQSEWRPRERGAGVRRRARVSRARDVLNSHLADRPGPAPSAPPVAVPRRSTEPAPSPRRRRVECHLDGRKAAAMPHTCWSGLSCRPILLWSKDTRFGPATPWCGSRWRCRPAGPVIRVRGFGRYQDLGHTVQVALRRV